MTKSVSDRTTVTQQLDGVEATVNTEPGEIYIEIPATSPRYIHAREGYRLLEGDIRSRTADELESPLLNKWRIDSISTETVVGIDIDTGESTEWGREWLVTHLATGEYSVDLRDFGRVSVSGNSVWNQDTADEDAETEPTVMVTVYANNGQHFTQQYVAESSGDWDSLSLVRQDSSIARFEDKVRERFDQAVATALEVEQRYT